MIKFFLNKIFSIFFILCFFGLIIFLYSNPAFSAGKMYQPRKEWPTGSRWEPKPKFEVCRLLKEIRRRDEVKCIYKRQSRGQNVEITNEDISFNCMAEISCKME